MKLDIKSFYPSTHGGHIFSSFKNVFHQAADVAGVLTKLCTVNNHIPTGSCISQIQAYISHKRLFDCIDKWCNKNNLRFTLYVDDITVSGDKANKSAVKTIGKMINETGLEYHKVKYFNESTAKEITGIILDNGEYLVPNKRQKKIFEEFICMRSISDDEELYRLGEKLIGKLNAAGQLDKRFKNWIGPVKAAMIDVRYRVDFLKTLS